MSDPADLSAHEARRMIGRRPLSPVGLAPRMATLATVVTATRRSRDRQRAVGRTRRHPVACARGLPPRSGPTVEGIRDV